MLPAWSGNIYALNVSDAPQKTGLAPTFGQPSISSIPPSEYKQHAHNWDVTQGYDGLMYFANMHGLMTYDGYSWELKQLPSSVASLHFSSDELLYAGLTGDFGIVHQEPDGRLRYESIFERLREAGQELPPIDFIDAFQILELDSIIYILTDAGLYAWDGQQIEYWENNIPFLVTDYESLLLMQEDNGELFIPGQPQLHIEIVDADGNPATLTDPLVGMLPGRNDSYRVMNQTGQMFAFQPMYKNDEAGAENLEKELNGYRLIIEDSQAPDFLADRFIYDVHAIDGHYYITTFNSGMFELDADGELIRHYSTKQGLNDNFILNLHKDNLGVIWLVNMYGISTLKNYTGISVIDGANGLENNIWGAGIYENDFYVGSSDGLYHARLNGQRPLQFDKMLNVEEDGVFTNFVTLPVPSAENPGFFAFSDAGLFRLRGKSAEYIDYRVGGNLFISSLFPGLIFTDEFAAHLRALRYDENGEWEVSERVERVFKDTILDTAEDAAGNIWFSTYSGGLYSLVFREADDRNLPAEAYREGPFGHDFRIIHHNAHETIDNRKQVHFSMVDGDLIFAHQNRLLKLSDASTYDNPVFEEMLTNRPRASMGVPANDASVPESVFLQLLEDSQGLIWYTMRQESNISLAGISLENPDFFYSPPLDLDMEFDTKMLHCNNCGHLFVVNHNNIYAIDYTQALNQQPDMPAFEVYLRKAETYNGQRIPLAANKSAAQSHTSTPLLDYEDARRAISFQAATNYHHTAPSNRISFRLHPVEDDFSFTDGKPLITYRNLREGRYTLELRAVNKLGEVAETTALNFVIQPPWYRSILAYLLYFLLFCGMLFAILRWRVQDIAKQRDLLSSKVKKRTAQLQKNSAELSRQRDQLTQANLLKVRLLRMTAHDLRSPLTAILGYSGLIEMEESKEEMKAHARTIHDISSRMRAIVQRMLASGARNLEQIDLELESIELTKPLRSTIDQLAVFLKERNQQIKFSIAREAEGVNIMGDEVRISEIFENLLSNAIKYSPEHSLIYVRIRTEREGKNAVVEIQDQGPGFSDKDIDKMFGEYQKLSTASDDAEKSVGLGLFIVKQLMMVHGGSVEVKNMPAGEGGGACFILYFPIPESPKKQQA